VFWKPPPFFPVSKKTLFLVWARAPSTPPQNGVFLNLLGKGKNALFPLPPPAPTLKEQKNHVG